MKIDFRSFKPPLLANVSVFLYFSPLCAIWSHLRPHMASFRTIWSQKTRRFSLARVVKTTCFWMVSMLVGLPMVVFGVPKHRILRAFLAFASLLRLVLENRRDLRCFFDRFFRVLLILAINFGRMSRLESHFWRACRRVVEISVLDVEKWMNVWGKIASLAGLPCLPWNVVFWPSILAPCMG